MLVSTLILIIKLLNVFLTIKKNTYLFKFKLIQFYSLAGHRIANNANMHFYTASKHATTVLSDGLRNELNALEKQFRVTVSGFDHSIYKLSSNKDL